MTTMELSAAMPGMDSVVLSVSEHRKHARCSLSSLFPFIRVQRRRDTFIDSVFATIAVKVSGLLNGEAFKKGNRRKCPF